MDFREEFYKKYNSTFKVHISDFEEESIKKMWNWYDFKYLPLIESYPKDSSILELGCGRGYLLEYLRKNAFNNIKGIDISEEQIKISNAKGLDVEVASAIEFLTENRKKFKIIFALDFVEHFYKDELIKLTEKIYESLDESGIFIFHTPNGQAIISPKVIYGDLTHITILTPNSAQQLLRAAGFRKIIFFETGPAPKNIFGFVRLIIWKIIKLYKNMERIADSGSMEKILTENFIGVAEK